jgi:antitoxin ParD1/3/4
MASMSVSLPDKMRGFIKDRVASGDYHNESEYIRDLVRRDQERREQRAQELLNSLRHAEAGGVSDRQLPEIMRDVKERLKARGEL